MNKATGERGRVLEVYVSTDVFQRAIIHRLEKRELTFTKVLNPESSNGRLIQSFKDDYWFKDVEIDQTLEPIIENAENSHIIQGAHIQRGLKVNDMTVTRLAIQNVLTVKFFAEFASDDNLKFALVDEDKAGRL